jgi:hypothetical protein
LARIRIQRDEGYIIFIVDDRKVGAVKITGRKNFPVVNTQILAWFKTERYTHDLTQLYRDMREWRIEGDWYVKDAIDMYLDHRQGRA